MLANHFLHPDHVVPAIEFLAALVEVSHFLVTKALMKTNTVLSQVFVFGLDKGDAGIHIQDALHL